MVMTTTQQPVTKLTIYYEEDKKRTPIMSMRVIGCHLLKMDSDVTYQISGVTVEASWFTMQIH